MLPCSRPWASGCSRWAPLGITQPREAFPDGGGPWELDLLLSCTMLLCDKTEQGEISWLRDQIRPLRKGHEPGVPGHNQNWALWPS